VDLIGPGGEVDGSVVAAAGEFDVVEYVAEEQHRLSSDAYADVVEPVPGGVRNSAGNRRSRLHGSVDARRDRAGAQRHRISGALTRLVVVELRRRAASVAASSGELHDVRAGWQPGDRVGAIEARGAEGVAVPAGDLDADTVQRVAMGVRHNTGD